MDAKCPNCDRVAVLDEEVTTVKCTHCGFEAKYDDYLKLMKEKIGEMAENLQLDRPGF
ncbi:MAG: zinc-domain-containing protein [Thaumarchaeota archaeon]|nr:MAG: zinc-domain-containing protein [Nitrososphaerota archaeon]